jgi:hypothetical protein
MGSKAANSSKGMEAMVRVRSPDSRMRISDQERIEVRTMLSSLRSADSASSRRAADAAMSSSSSSSMSSSAAAWLLGSNGCSRFCSDDVDGTIGTSPAGVVNGVRGGAWEEDETVEVVNDGTGEGARTTGIPGGTRSSLLDGTCWCRACGNH